MRRAKITDTMRQHGWIATVFLATLLYGCAEDPDVGTGLSNREERDLPIEFVMAVPGMQQAEAEPASRVQKDQFKFEEGDVIHVNATFTLLDGRTTSDYDCLELRDGRWTSKENEDPNTEAQPMSWPWDTDKATFRVYYLAHSSGILVESTERLLDNLRTEADPVYAEAVDVPYGAAVHLVFNHLCTKLTVCGLKTGEEEFWLQKTGLQDAYVLSRDAESDFLDFRFLESTESLRPDLDRRVMGTSDGEGNAVFYLAPGDYSNLKITYPYGLAYLTLTDIAALGDLKANTAYTLRINPGSGNVDEADEDEWWPDPDDDQNDIKLDTEEINGLLKAIHDGQEYLNKEGIPILGVEENGTALLRNVDFQDNPFTWQVLPNGTVFDGKYHYIKHVSGSALFSQINGRVSNLGIAGGKITRAEEVSDIGILAPVSSVSAVMTNLRLKTISISVDSPLIDDVCNIGVLIGSNSGTIYEVALGGEIRVEIESENAPGRLHVGGLVGQSSGRVRNVSLLDDDDPIRVHVICNCRFPLDADENYAEGDRYVGGLIGLSTGQTDNCLIEATVTAAGSQGVLMYTGGLIGMLRGAEEGDTENPANVALTNSIASCEVTGGLAYPLDNTINGEGRSYTGGLVGYAYCATTITDCKSLGKVHGHDYQANFSPLDNAYYGVGGAFGQLYGMNTTVSTVDARSQIVTSLAFPKEEPYFIGLFAGRSDRDHSAENTTHGSGDYEFIGEIGNIHY